MHPEPAPSVAIHEVAQSLIAAARATRQRRTLVLAGQREWCVAQVRVALQVFDSDDVLWVSENAPPGARELPAGKAHTVLGGEVDAVVFDAYSGMDPDALGAASGAIRGGGLLLMLAPPVDEWPHFADPEYGRIAVAGYRPDEVTGRLLQRMVRVIRSAAGVMVVEQGLRDGSDSPAISGDLLQPAVDLSAVANVGDQCRTDDQRRAVEALVKVMTGKRRRPVVLTSDRGRGKSAALGIAAARLLRDGTRHIIVTGPRLDAVTPVFEHAHRLLPGATASKAALHFGDVRLEFVAPDQLLLARPPADLVLVDEAAAVPTPLLEQILARYSRTAFATTVHGYEGTGRGFAVRFHKVLDARTRGWKALRLETPIRWAPDDPLERFVFRALLLDASAASDAAVAGLMPERYPDSVTVQRLDRDALAADETTLGELFGLLVLAHYRTRPYDLRYLLDGPNVSVYVLRYDGHVAATALVCKEGGFGADAARAILENRARPHGHLIPESLAAHAGFAEAPRLMYARVMRIAVHPAAQCRGLGTRLLEAVIADARQEGIDCVGSSFGATPQLLSFWEKSQLLAVRVSAKRGAASGAHSVIVLRALSDAGRTLHDAARRRLVSHLPHQLSDPLRDIDASLALYLLRDSEQAGVPSLDDHDWRELLAFAFGHRVFAECVGPIWTLAVTALSDVTNQTQLTRVQRGALVMKVLQKRSWPEVAEQFQLAGRAAAVEILREALRVLLLARGDERVQAEATRLAAQPPAHDDAL
ncbi:MAG: tRNA(Met) cytidine acetyltransferase [Pseudomonadota bacterium]|nr:MAG: tRNA(Met) cytidine acetyltransferase [Pseudomonadota bacterium]